ncbi:tuberoinfundibular peptide of 39 residues [Dasypus novemcinctus]|uniref:tuberoinfundibular peptide of 39 residues n=1 Tax=Dasypus novemcinctus TaxID=9361 RepID=UPI00265EDFA6|nr:tuberoinfundibular peptide of 39 residues [Dasypus novemcinctus]
METCQVPRSHHVRRRLLLLLLLLPWATRPASGVALPPAAALGPRPPGSPVARRSLVLADDAAFRERARLRAALERRHWLNSYMHQLRVLDAPGAPRAQ